MVYLQRQDLNLIHLVGVLAILLLLFHLLLWKPRSSFNLETPPEAAGAWPIVGHLPVLSKSHLPHKTFASMADEYGPIFRVRFGAFPAVVVCSAETAKECFTSENDLALSSRPQLLAQEILGYDRAIFVFVPYGPYWREIRKIATVELLSHRRCESLLSPIQASEVGTAVKQMYELWTGKKNDSGQVLVDLTQWFTALSLNVVLRIVAGKRYSSAAPGSDKEELRRCEKALRELFRFLGMFIVADALPFLRWFDFGGHEKDMKKTAKEIDEIVGGWLEEHKRKRKDLSNSDCKDQDFMDVMLSILNGSEIGGYDVDTIVKATCLTIIAGGSNTSMITLTWAVSLLLNHPKTLKKAQEELDTQIGKQRNVVESDCANLIYLQAIVKETLRLHPAAPLSAPRLFTEDCTIGGYHIAKGTRLILNIWKIQTDPKAWHDPLEFKPERFLSSHKDVNVKDPNFELLPFGGGRRICPVITFSLRMVPFMLARFLHAFNVSTVDHTSVDMSESFGLTNVKATPLKVLVAPRLPRELYELR